MSRIRSLYIFCIVLITAFLAGCTLPIGEGEPPLPEDTATPTFTPLPITEETAQPANKIITLEIWIPPQFDPGDGSPAGKLFNSQLEEFASRRPNIRLETRIKDVEGPGGIVDTLTTASAAAPLALPDLVALPHDALQNAAALGVLRPFDGLTDAMDDPDWYNFARQLSHVQNSVFGIPFAGDALIMVYRPDLIEESPADWVSVLESTEQIAFPASDLDSLLTLTFYRASGGAVLDEDGNPFLDMVHLTDTLTFYQQGSKNGVFPYWLAQYETDEQAWVSYDEKQANMVITWASRYLQTIPGDSVVATIPTPDNILYTTATGWAWALASTDPDRQALSAELAEFLTRADYLSAWNAAAGFLPPRPEALSIWDDSQLASVLDIVCSSAQLPPSADVLSSVGPLLNKSIIDVLKEQADPATAAQSAIDGLAAP
ncbi:MAG: extracellular solute-binding protein [Chloroflexota bacterium]|nr:extracellular solute-binding protein [Chloroflexota bacterium]